MAFYRVRMKGMKVMKYQIPNIKFISMSYNLGPYCSGHPSYSEEIIEKSMTSLKNMRI